MFYNFTCATCSESFNIHFKNIIKKDTLICPNCSNKLPDELFGKLQSATKLLMEVNDNANKKDNSHLTHANPNHFYFQIQK